MQDRIARAQRTAAAATIVTACLAGAKAGIGLLTGATVLLADAVHSGADLLALGASWFGLKLARKSPTERFPYGFFRAETLAALLVALIIVYLGVALLVKGVRTLGRSVPYEHAALAIGTALLSVGVGIALALLEKRVSRATGSQSLAATADEAAMDVISSSVVLIALVAGLYHAPYVTGAVTILVSLAVLRVGIRHGWAALLSLMDASVDPGLERSVREIVESIPAVRDVHELHARQSGPYYFIEGHVLVAGSMDVTRSHTLSHEAEGRVRRQHPRVEGVILHVEPFHASAQRVLVAVEDPPTLDAPVSRHFGRAPLFLVATVERGKITETEAMENPSAGREVRAGLSAIRELVGAHTIDAVLVRDIGEITYFALRDNSIEVYRCGEVTARAALEAFAAGQLAPLSGPTHSSDERLA